MGESSNNQHYLRLQVSGIDIPFNNCRELVVREWMFDPIPSMTMKFVGGQEWTKGVALQDQLEILTEFGSMPVAERPAAVNAVWHARAWDVEKGQERAEIVLAAHLAVPNLVLPAQFRAFREKTAAEVLQALGGEFGLKPADRPCQTQDLQTWLQAGQTNIRFVQHLLQQSWVAEGDALFAWIDRRRGWRIDSLASLKAKAKEPKRLVFNPEGVADDLDPEEMDKDKREWPFAGFVWHDRLGVHNIRQGYGTAMYRYDAKDFQLELLKPDKLDPIAPYMGMFKENAGKSVEVAYGQNPPSAHPRWYMAAKNRQRVVQAITGAWAVVEARPHPSWQVGEMVEVKLGELAQGQSDRQATPWDGPYLLGGIIHQHRPDYGTKAFLVLFRAGSDMGLADQGESIRSVKGRGK